MTSTTQRSRRLEVRSSDGTPLALWVDGHGPPLVLVHGSLQDHTASSALVGALREQVTTYSMDRRGFGASGDTPPYAIEREFEDVAAVVDAVAARTGGPVALWGHSYGAGCAMGGAARSPHVGHVVLYEPSLGLRYPRGSIDEIERAVVEGDDERAITVVLADVLGFSERRIAAMRAGPGWAERVATAPTVAREARAEQEWVYRAGRFDGITAPTLLLSGSDSPPDLHAATRAASTAIPHAEVRTLHGHAHIAHRTDPEVVAGIVLDHLAS